MYTITTENAGTKEMKKAISGYIEKINWVLLATGKDQLRTNICNTIFSDNGKLVAVDGNRLHILDMIKAEFPESLMVPGGLWKVISASKKIIVLQEFTDCEFPEYKRVIPDHVNCFAASNSISILMFQLAQKGIGVNYRYLIDAIGDDNTDDVISVVCYHNGGKSAVKLVNNDMTAVIMPLRMPEVK